MSAQAAKRRRADAVNNRPGGLRRRIRTKQSLLGTAFGGKVKKRGDRP